MSRSARHPSPAVHLLRLLLLLLLSVLAAAACGGGEGPTEPPPTEPRVAVVEVSPDSALVADSGSTRDFDATARDSAGNELSGVAFSWGISDTTVATVDEEGTATVRGEGRAEVRATAEGVTGTAKLVARFQPIAGPPGEPVNAHIPDESFEAPDSADFARTDGGSLISRRDVVLMFSGGTTVEGANELLEGLGARVQGGEPLGRLLYVEVPDRSLEEALALLDSLNADPAVASAALDEMGYEKRGLPPHNARKSWRWDRASASGNWGLAMIRAPQMWNLGSAVDGSASVCAANIEGSPNMDAGHPDVTVDGATPDEDGDHATLVSGVIGASWGNQQGVEGVSPWLARVYGRPMDSYGTIVDSVPDLVANVGCLRAFNYSVGEPAKVVGGSDRKNVRAQGIQLKQSTDSVAGATGTSRFFLVAASGNEDGAAKFDDPISFAADSFGGRFISVEATDSTDSEAAFSDDPGTVAAPGVCVRATEAPDGSSFDAGSCPARSKDAGSPNDGRYATSTGTSFAAPHVTGLIAALWSLDPSLSLSTVRTLMTPGKYTVDTGGTPERIDAFAAAMGIDQENGGDRLQRALVNVDDGTADGNLRVDPFTGDPVPAVGTPDRPGDDDVTMADFRAFRDAFVQLNADSLRRTRDEPLDGPPEHVKKDLNRDGCVGGQKTSPERHSGVDCDEQGVTYAESVFPRLDFNGNGKIRFGGGKPRGEVPENALAPFKVDPEKECTSHSRGDKGCLTDLDVFATVYDADFAPGGENVQVGDVEEAEWGSGGDCDPPPEGWTPTELLADRGGTDVIDYLASFDLHVRAAEAAGDDHQAPFEVPGKLAFVLPAVPASGLTVSSNKILKCRTRAYDGVVTVPGKSAELLYLVTREGEGVTTVRYFRVNSPVDIGKRGDDVAFTASFDTLALHRSDGTSAFDVAPSIQFEWIYRSVSDPVEDPDGHAYWTSPCLANEASTISDWELYKALVDKARELWLEGEGSEPKSLVREKVESFGHSTEILWPIAIELGDESCPSGEDRAKLWGAGIEGSPP